MGLEFFLEHALNNQDALDISLNPLKSFPVQTKDQILILVHEHNLQNDLIHVGISFQKHSSLLMKNYHHHDGQTNHHQEQTFQCPFPSHHQQLALIFLRQNQNR